MSRICTLCERYLRYDDSGQVIQFFDGQGTVTAYACSECAARLYEIPLPWPACYPCGRNYQFPVCGICRHAMREDDLGNNSMRIAEEDICQVRARERFPALKPGCYQACCECIDLFKGSIRNRLEHAGMAVPSLESFGGNWLL